MKRISGGPKSKQPRSTFSKGMMIACSVLALLLVLLSLIDLCGYHLLVPEVIPMGCLVEVALLLIWLAGTIARRCRTDSGQRVFTLVAALIIMLMGLLTTPFVLQYAQIVMPHKYAVLESPDGRKIAVLDVVDNGFSGVEATLEMLGRMDERQAYLDAVANGTEYEPLPEDHVPSCIEVDENGEIVYDENGFFEYTLEGYDSEAYGYIYSAYPVKLGIFYCSNAQVEGAIYRGISSESKMIFEWEDDGTLILSLEDPLPGDFGEVKLAN